MILLLDSDPVGRPAVSETAGLKMMKNSPVRFFDLRGRNV